MRRLTLCLLFALAVPSTHLAGQDAVVSAPDVPAVGADPANSTATAQTTDGSGLPQVVLAPRSMRPYWHVFIAFAVAWALLFGYALMLGRRFAALEKQVERMESGGA